MCPSWLLLYYYQHHKNLLVVKLQVYCSLKSNAFHGISQKYWYIRLCFYLELQFRQHGNVSIIKMWSFLKHYDGAQPGKRKTTSATPTGDWESLMTFRILLNNIYQKQIKYHVFNAITNSELIELVPVFTIRPAFPTSVKKVNTSFKNVWRT
jgi:hypothetical protein